MYYVVVFQQLPNYSSYSSYRESKAQRHDIEMRGICKRHGKSSWRLTTSQLAKSVWKLLRQFIPLETYCTVCVSNIQLV